MSEGQGSSAPRVLLYAPRDFTNVCVLARTLDSLGFRECHVFDPHRMVREQYGKSYARRLRLVSSGAFEQITWLQVADPLAFVREYAGRTVATVAEPGAKSLCDFRFEPDDLLIFGSERHGLPEPIVAAATVSVTIPTQGRTQSLNLAAAASIILFEAVRQLSATSSADCPKVTRP